MKLTNYIRDAFISAAMNDVPAIDYADQIVKLIREDAVAQLPPEVRAIYDDKKLRPYVATQNYWSTPAGVPTVNIPAVDRGDFKQSAAAKAQLKDLGGKLKAQTEQRMQLEARLRSVTYACSTRKALAEALPEFVKYMPAEEAKTRSLPVVANVVADFVKAGWPKDKAAAA